MSVQYEVHFYMDVNVHGAITEGLRSRGVDVLTSQEDGTRRFKDSDLLDRATELGRVIFTQDDDFLRIADERYKTGQEFAGIIYARQESTLIGRYIDDLEAIAGASNPDEWINRVEYLPL